MIEPIRVKADSIELLNQLLLPTTEEWVLIQTAEDTAEAIRNMVVRGAPAIGVTAAYGFAMGFRNTVADSESVLRVKKLLLSTRPTAVNLHWAVEHMVQFQKGLIGQDASLAFIRLFSEAKRVHDEDRQMNQTIGRYGLDLFTDKCSYDVLTHCNAGSLATGGYGTALGMIYSLHEAGKLGMVFVDETRPYLQGARLTAYELEKAGINYRVICDNMAASLMRQGKIDAVITGADRIAKNGDTANKIGTYNLAVLCSFHNVPLYIAAPYTTLDRNIADGSEIVIEDRPAHELAWIGDRQIVPDPEKVINPSFDVTPANLIKAIVTNEGVFFHPYRF
ncbi:MAG: S-methyl-5-thioribose-1-phosphate isomerase [Candidatus Cloacimonetes bacterium]|nr:S-methyl-5-thioribose-1-phosphate isomerase [Candidatus Cloacimonadota bacterium]